MMLDKTKFNQNLIPLDKQQKEKIIAILEEYYERIDKLLQDLPANEKNMQKPDKDYIDGHLLASYLLAIGEGYDFLIDKEHWLANTYNILLYFKVHIEKYHKWSLFYGLGDFAFSLLDIVIKSGEFEKFLKSLNQLICNIISEQIVLFKKEESTVHKYDVITGMSGIGRYLLLYIEQFLAKEDCLQEKTALEHILKYFVRLSENIENKEIIGFYVANKNLWPEERKKQYLYGTLDFGIAHGMAGPLALMTYAAEKDIIVSGQRRAIEKIINIYNEHTAGKYNIIYWPTILPAEFYKQPDVVDVDSRMGWCYGSIGISCILYKSSKYLGINATKYLHNIEQIAKTPRQIYNLISPIICHGFAGTLAIFNQIYKETYSEEILPGLYMCLNELMNQYNSAFPYGFKNIDYVSQDLLDEDDDTYLNGATGVIVALLALFNPNSLHEKHLLIS